MKNLTAAAVLVDRSFSSCPHRAMRKYIGISISSQKKKYRNRSIARKMPITPPSVHSRLAWKTPTRDLTVEADATTDSMPSTLASMTMTSDSPSRARWNSIPNRLIQSAAISYCQAGATDGSPESEKSPVNHTTTAGTNTAAMLRNAITRARPALSRPRLVAQQARPPMNGMNNSQQRSIGRPSYPNINRARSTAAPANMIIA